MDCTVVVFCVVVVAGLLEVISGSVIVVLGFVAGVVVSIVVD